MTMPPLKSDCANCAALCCVSLAFDKGDHFAIDKPAGIACPNLGPDHRCAIHADLSTKGFNGCVMYDCSGAGQRVTQEVFHGQSWQDDPKLLAPMMDAFRAMRQVHELLVLLGVVENLPLSDQQRATHATLSDALLPDAAWTQDSLTAFETGPVPGQVRAYLKTLSTHFPQGRS